MNFRSIILLVSFLVAACSKPEEDALEQLGVLVKEAEAAGDPRIAVSKYKEALAARKGILVKFAHTSVASNLMAFDGSHPYSAVSIESNIEKKTQEACQKYMERACLDFLLSQAVADIKIQIDDKRWRRQHDTAIITVLRSPEPAYFAYQRGLIDEAMFLAEQMRNENLAEPLIARMKLDQLYKSGGYEAAVAYTRGLKGEALEEARRWGVSELYFDKSPDYSSFEQEFGRPGNAKEGQLEEWARSSAWGKKLKEMAVDDIDGAFVSEIVPTTMVRWIGFVEDAKSQKLLDLVGQWNELPKEVHKDLFYKAVEFNRLNLIKKLLPVLEAKSVGEAYLAAAHVMIGDYSLAQEYLKQADPMAVYLEMLHEQLNRTGQEDLAGQFLGKLDQMSAVWWKGSTHRNVWGKYYVCALDKAGRADEAAKLIADFRYPEEGLIAFAGCLMPNSTSDHATQLWHQFFGQLRQLDSLQQLEVIGSDEVAGLNWPEENL